MVIPAYNEEGVLERLLDSLEGQDAEVIVVAGGSDGTVAIAEAHEAVDMTIEENNSSGPAKSRNEGAEEAEGDILVFTDADVVVPDDWVENHVSNYEDERVVGVGGPARPIGDRLKHRLFFSLVKDYWYRFSYRIGFIQQPGFNSSFRKEDFLEEGGFNEEMAYMEDTELSLRIRDHGKVVFDPSTEVRVSSRRERQEGYLKLVFRYGRAYTRYYLLDKELEEGYFKEVK